MDNVVPFIAPKPKVKACSFCKRDESKVKSLLGSQICNAHICGDCIRHAKTRLLEGTNESSAVVPTD